MGKKFLKDEELQKSWQTLIKLSILYYSVYTYILIYMKYILYNIYIHTKIVYTILH